MSGITDLFFGSTNSGNKTVSQNIKNIAQIPEINTVKKTLNQLINKIIKLINEKKELENELAKMKENKALENAKNKNSEKLLVSISEFDSYLSNINKALSSDDILELLQNLLEKLSKNNKSKSLKNLVNNSVNTSKNTSTRTIVQNQQVNSRANSGVINSSALNRQVNAIASTVNKKNLLKSPGSLNKLLGLSKNNSSIVTAFKKNVINSKTLDAKQYQLNEQLASVINGY
jgi:hypothetical protein